MMHQYFVSHKPVSLPPIENARLIQVGSLDDFTDLRDNTQDNIAEKNPGYCELSALYWLWKNDREDEWIGINHYRRWFLGLDKPEQVLADLQSADIIVPRLEPYKESVWDQYCLESGFACDLEHVRQILADKYPDDVPAFDEVMKSGGLHQYNMMITSKKLFDAYCSWLFDILFALEGITDLSGRNDYQKRIYGFLGERLLNVYLKARHLRVREYPVFQSEMPLTEKAKLVLRRQKNRYIFRKNHK